MFFYIRNLKINIVQTFALYAPIFILYPIAEIEVLGRKEIILFLIFVVSLFLSEKKYHNYYLNIFSFLFLPLALLVWEEVVLFFPFFAAVIIIKNNLKNFKEVFQYLLIIFFPSILIFSYIWLNPLTIEGRDTMCSYLDTNFGERCYMSALLLVDNNIYFSTFKVVHQNAQWSHYTRYILIFIIGFLPLNLLVSQNNFIKKNNFINKNFKVKTLFFLLYLPSILLFTFGYDWGRWINITYSFSILFYLYLLKNFIITNNFKINNIILKKFFKKKTIVTLIFILFAFGWNPKTVVTGDIASFPGYRIPVKFLKILIEKN